MKHNIVMNTKTLGKENAALFTGLASQGKMVFSIADAQKVSGKNYQATLQALHRLINAGWLVSSGSGVYAIVSPEAGSEAIPAANRLVIGRELVGEAPYYFSYDTALSLHTLITRPVPDVKISTPRRLQSRKVLKVKYNFIYSKPENIWGTELTWVSEGERISISDPERTILDSLARPDLSGGIVEAATALQIGAERFDFDKLISYAKRFDNQAVIKRLGFLLELLGLTTQSNIDHLQAQISPSYALLDPYLPDDGNYYSRWKLRINIEPNILEKAAST
jgi:predicted transcriptional regulator of viral defense system